MEAKLKHLEFIEAVIARMATNSFLFKGWSITIASALAGFAAVESRETFLAIGIVATLLFWALDGYYLWLERRFIDLYNAVAATAERDINFEMKIDKTEAAKKWLETCFRPHLWLFYGVMLFVDVIGLLLLRSQ